MAAARLRIIIGLYVLVRAVHSQIRSDRQQKVERLRGGKDCATTGTDTQLWHSEALRCDRTLNAAQRLLTDEGAAADKDHAQLRHGAESDDF